MGYPPCCSGVLTMPMTLTVPVNLPDVRVLAHRMLEDGTVLIEVESTLQSTPCHHCGRIIDRFHRVRPPDPAATFAGIRASGGRRNPAEALPLSVLCGRADHHPALHLV